MSNVDETRMVGTIRDQAVLDLTHVQEPADIEGIELIEDVACVVVPERLASAFSRVSVQDVATTVVVPDDVAARVHIGLLPLAGDALGGDDEALIVVGTLAITSPVSEPLPRRITVVGVTVAPREGMALLGPRLSGGTGTVSYYNSALDQEFHVKVGDVEFGADALVGRDSKADDVLMLAGRALVRGPVRSVGYSRIFVAGQLVAPESSRFLLEPRTEALGQLAWYKSDQPRTLRGDMTLRPEFFRLLDAPTSLVRLRKDCHCRGGG